MAEVITITMPVGKKTECQDFAKKKGLGLSAFIVKACEQYIENEKE